MQKEKQIIALDMAEVADAVKMDVLRLQGAVPAFASGMVEEKDVKKKVAQRVLRATLAYVYHMEGAGAVSMKDVERVPKEVPCSARLMEEGNAA